MLLRTRRHPNRYGGWSSKCTEPVGLGVIRSRVRPDASCSPTGPRIVGASSQSRCDRPPRSHTYVTAHLTPTSISRQNDLTPTTTLWPRRSSVCARPYPSERKDHGGTSAASSTPALEYVDWFSHRRPGPPKPNASPCLPPPSTPGTPPTSVPLSTTVYQHLNLDRRYDVTDTTTPPPGQLRPLTDAFCTDAGSTPSRGLWNIWTKCNGFRVFVGVGGRWVVTRGWRSRIVRRG